MRATTSRVATLLICAVLSPRTLAGEDVYRRVVVDEDHTGVAEIRTAFGVRLTVPVECGKERCPEERVYDAVIRVDLANEHRERVGGSYASRETSLGSILVAVRFAPEDLEALRREIAETLRGLSAQSFTEPFLGWTAMELPLETQSRAIEPTYVCLQSEGRVAGVVEHYRKVETTSAGGEITVTGSRTLSSIPASLCDDMALATLRIAPETVRTLPSPVRVRETAVSWHDLQQLEVAPGALPDRPAGVRLKRTPIPEGISSRAEGASPDGVVSHATVGEGGRRLDAEAEATSLPLQLVDTAWLMRWTTTVTAHRLGSNPVDELLERQELLVAYLATRPADLQEPVGSTMTFGPRTSFEGVRPSPRVDPPRVDRETFRDAVASRLDKDSGDPHQLLRELAAEPPAGLLSEGWLAVVCDDDGTATYAVVPTRARNRVTNGAQLCGSIETALGTDGS